MAGSRRRFTATTSRCRQPPSLWRARSSVRTTKSWRSEEHTSELQSQSNLVCRLLLEKKKKDQRDDVRDEHAVRVLGFPERDPRRAAPALPSALPDPRPHATLSRPVASRLHFVAVVRL